jgi:phospholipid/cholesterol/gamma-HCH transport system substrate-binding protein
MQNNIVETVLAAAVMVVAAGFVFFAYSTTQDGSVGTYDVVASLSTVEGVAVSTDVRLHGVKIGKIASIDMDPRTYRPIAHLAIRDDVRIPADSSARIASSGINGGTFLSVQPGRSAKMVAPGVAWKAN